VAGASVKSEVVGHVKGPKIVVQKFKRRKDYRRKQGHRQNFTRVTISKISK
jgi:large subunit ribosomal protein L21